MSMGGGSSQPSTQNVTNKTEIPQYLQDFSKENMAVARDIAARPFVPYEGQRTADFSPFQTAGFEQIGRNATGAPLSGLYDPGIRAASGNTSSRYGDTLAPGDTAPWMNPFVEEALNPQLAAIDRASAATGRRIDARAAGAGAFGDARTGVLEGENERNTAELRSDVIGTGYKNAFDRAVAAAGGAFTANAGQFNADRTANLAASDELARLLAAKYGYQQTTADDLLAAGKTQQQQEQADLTTAYQDFLNQFEYPQEMLNLRLATQTGTPYSTTRLTMTPYSPWAQGIGAASSIAGLVGNLYGRPAGGAAY